MPFRHKQGAQQTSSSTALYLLIHEVSGRQHRVLGIFMWCPIHSITGVRMPRFYTRDGSPEPTTQPRRSSSASSLVVRRLEMRSWIQA